MKKILLVISIFCCSFLAFAGPDEFHIIHVKGQIINKTTGLPIKVGDKINVNDQVKFLSADAAAVVISTQRGRFTIKAQAGQAASSELVALVKNVVLPIKSNANLSTRGGESDGVIDLKGYFGTGKYAIIGEKLPVKLNAAKYPVTETKFFIFRYENNTVPVSKKVEHNGEVLIFDKTALFTVQGTLLNPEKIDVVEIYHFDKATQASNMVAKFSPVFIPEEQLKEELKSQVVYLKSIGVKSEEIHKELLGFIQDVYGKVDEDLANKWLKTHITI